jgi:diguanylate cyclase (GGDEF)-like protein
VKPKYLGRIVSQIFILMMNIGWTGFSYSQGDYNNNPSARILFECIFFLLQAGMAWWCGKQYDYATYFAQRDVLTGTYNRLFISKTFPKMTKKSKQDGKELSVLMVDVNNLKLINDTYGHQAGDTVIQHVAYIITTDVRSSDFVARFGGDEFVIVAPGTDKIGALALSERINDNMLAVAISEALYEKPSISIGIAVYPEDGKTLDELIGVADARMYENKGKNINLM